MVGVGKLEPVGVTLGMPLNVEEATGFGTTIIGNGSVMETPPAFKPLSVAIISPGASSMGTTPCRQGPSGLFRTSVIKLDRGWVDTNEMILARSRKYSAIGILNAAPGVIVAIGRPVLVGWDSSVVVELGVGPTATLNTVIKGLPSGSVPLMVTEIRPGS
jgi:hypothetical protein